MTQAVFSHFILDLPEEWDDVTEEMDEGDLVTLAKPESGKGALQISSAVYRGGAVPRIATAQLEELRDDFARTRKLGIAIATSSSDSSLAIAAGSYRSGKDFIRVWYVSDHVNVALVTYVCQWRFRDDESATCERIVQSLQFRGGE